MAELVMDGVTKRFGATIAVADLTFTVGDGEFLVLLGPLGSRLRGNDGSFAKPVTPFGNPH